MNSKEFYEKVVKMRAAQKNYFKTRSTTYLKESKKLEKEIDAEIERVTKIQEDRRSPKLF
ncbi:MAG: hypothetical protein IJX16_00135 [Clostridia bacterium]|nr:hypothetical protein [Clostridia bacterium]